VPEITDVAATAPATPPVADTSLAPAAAPVETASVEATAESPTNNES
jgi:hypothetical protein